MKWIRLAANQGNAGAQFNLGVAYYKGQGVTRDDREAVKWFRIAAQQGDQDAQQFLFKLSTATRHDDLVLH